MKNMVLLISIVLCCGALFELWGQIFAPASTTAASAESKTERAGQEGNTFPDPPESMPKITFIQGSGFSTPTQMYKLVKMHNPGIHSDYLKMIIYYYITESRYEGINHDVAFAQMCHETNFLKYTGVVHPRQFNFAGIGAVDNQTPGNFFPDAQTGIRAHIQHLKAYADINKPNHPIVDPRYHLITLGSAPLLSDLTGKWAVDPGYHLKITKHLIKLISIKATDDLED